MKILIIASDKGDKFVPFIEEQIAALQQAGVEIIRYGVTGKGIAGYLRELPALRRFIRAERPDIIHAHYGLCGLLANLQRLVPVVTTYHGSDINVPSVLCLSKIAIRLSAHNIFVSQRNMALALGKVQAQHIVERASTQPEGRLHHTPYTKHTLLPCGVNLTDDQLTSRTEARKALGIADGTKVVLFAGAFTNAVKDAPLAQEAVSFASNLSPLASGLTSDSVPASRLSPFASNLILQELCGFTRTEVNCWMCAANCLLMTSKTEGSPQVIKEAMACGCPIVSVDVGDVAERTSGVEGCYIVRSRDPHAIAEALQLALAFEGKTDGRDKILDMGLSNKQVAELLVDIYQQVLT